ncbi:hypothetical protein N0V86_003762 [Didymella sp. IMI 355093]|nr:hypothetical protein N0V86_003762 [Didymella sp. IMI 355093]
MPSSCAEALCQSGDGDNITKSKRGKVVYETGTVKFTAVPAAMRGLYAAPRQRRVKRYSRKIEQLDRACEKDGDPNDPIIKHSMYPQMNGKRRSELEADVTKYAGVRVDMPCRDHMARNDLLVRRTHSTRRVRRPRSVKSYTSSNPDSDADSDTDSDYSSDYVSDDNAEGRPIRVCIYPQAKYIKDPVDTPVETPLGFELALNGFTNSAVAKPTTSHIPSYRNWKRDLLPHTELQILRRRQTMNRAREVLEPFYRRYLLVNAKSKKGLVEHGGTQWFTEPYHRVRLQNSRLLYAVRKATQAGLNQHSPMFSHAMTRRAQNERFCEMSDVDGQPVDETLLIDFLRVLRKFQVEADVPKDPKLAMVRPGELAQRTSIDKRNNLRRADSGATMRARARQPVPVSQCDWDSSDDEAEAPKRLTKMKR